MKFTIGRTTFIVQHTDYLPQRIIRFFVVLGLALACYLYFQIACNYPQRVLTDRLIYPTKPPVRSIPVPTNWNR